MESFLCTALQLESVKTQLTLISRLIKGYIRSTKHKLEQVCRSSALNCIFLNLLTDLHAHSKQQADDTLEDTSSDNSQTNDLG